MKKNAYERDVSYMRSKDEIKAENDSFDVASEENSQKAIQNLWNILGVV